MKKSISNILFGVFIGILIMILLGLVIFLIYSAYNDNLLERIQELFGQQKSSSSYTNYNNPTIQSQDTNKQKSFSSTGVLTYSECYVYPPFSCDDFKLQSDRVTFYLTYKGTEIIHLNHISLTNCGELFYDYDIIPGKSTVNTIKCNSPITNGMRGDITIEYTKK